MFRLAPQGDRRAARSLGTVATSEASWTRRRSAPRSASQRASSILGLLSGVAYLADVKGEHCEIDAVATPEDLLGRRALYNDDSSSPRALRLRRRIGFPYCGLIRNYASTWRALSKLGSGSQTPTRFTFESLELRRPAALSPPKAPTSLSEQSARRTSP